MKIIAKHILNEHAPIELGPFHIIEFGEGYETIAIMIHKGHIEVRSPQGARIAIEPRAANSVWVSVVDRLG